MEGLQYQQGYNPMMSSPYASQPYGSQFGQHGLFGANAGNPLAGLAGSGITGLLGNQSIGRPVNDVINGLSQPYNNIDPVTAAYAQQAQLAQLAQHLAQHVSQQMTQQQPGRLSPFGLDPISLAVAQQRAQFGQQSQFAPFGLNPLNRIDPITAAYLQQAQVAQLYQQLALQAQLGQQGQFGLPYGNQFGQGQLGQPQLGQGWFAGQNPWTNQVSPFGRNLPFQSGFMGAPGLYGGQVPVC